MSADRHSPSRTGSRRRLGWSALISVLLHLLGALVVLFSFPRWGCNPEPIGSNELDVDLVQPRLAPPIKQSGRSHGDPGRGQSDEEGRPALAGAAARAARKVQDARRPEAEEERWRVSPPLPRPTLEGIAEQRARRSSSESPAQPRQLASIAPSSSTERPRPQVVASKAESGAAARLAAPELTGRLAVPEVSVVDASPAPEDLPRRAREGKPTSKQVAVAGARADLQRLFADREVRAAAPPVQAAAAVAEESEQRKQLNQSARRARREREARADRWLAEMNAASRLQHSEGAGPVEGTSAVDGGAGKSNGTGSGRSPRYGLRFYLAGRPVQSNHVVTPPEAVEIPKVQCKVSRLDITPAMVRMLVSKDGRVGIAYLKHSSSSRAFDRCALGHARAIRFRPGEDGTGAPLDVWINVRVEPSMIGSASLAF